MYSFKIYFAFDSSEPIDYTKYAKTFEEARVKFNENSKKRSNGRTIKTIDLFPNEFCVTLNSTTDLEKPSKALVKLSQFLIASGKFNKYTDGKRLLRSKSFEDVSHRNTLSDTELLTTLVGWILNEDKNESATAKKSQRQTIEEIKTVILNAGIIVK